MKPLSIAVILTLLLCLPYCSANPVLSDISTKIVQRFMACLNDTYLYGNQTGRQHVIHFYECDGELNATKCLPVTTLYNGSKECLDGFDEGPIGRLMQQAYSRARSHKWDFESKTNEVRAKTCRLHGMPDGCSCNVTDILICDAHNFTSESLATVRPREDLKYLHLHNWPDNRLSLRVFPNIGMLVAFNSSVETIMTDDLPLPKLHFLKIEHSSLNTLERGALNQWNLTQLVLRYNDLGSLNFLSNVTTPYLVSVDLSFNKITALLKGQIPETIQDLNLEGNEISLVEEDALGDLNSLYELTLSNNHLVDINWNTLIFHSLKRLSVSGNKLTSMDNLHHGKTGLQFLDLSRNDIQSLHNSLFSSFPKLEELHLGYNNIHRIDESVFVHQELLEKLYLQFNALVSVRFLKPLKNLRILKLEGNNIIKLSGTTFSSNMLLLELDMSSNPLSEISTNFLSSLQHLKRLEMKGIELPRLSKNMFSLPHIEVIQFEYYEYCRYVPQVARCLTKYASSEGISSFYDLLSIPILRILAWSMAIATLVGNSIVIVTRAIAQRSDATTHGVTILHLAIADICMGLYLVIICSQDVIYRGSYNTYALEWTTSSLCKTAGILAMVSCIQSMLILTLLAIERRVVVANPLRTKPLKIHQVQIICSCMWLISFGISIWPAFDDKFVGNIYSLSDICFPLHIIHPWAQGWPFTLILFVIVNSILLVLMGVCYAGLLTSVYRTHKRTEHMSTTERSLTWRLLVIVATDAACWLPLIGLKVGAMGGLVLQPLVNAWLAVLVVPVNSALNPWLYTFSTPSFLNKLKHHLACVVLAKSGASPVNTPRLNGKGGRYSALIKSGRMRRLRSFSTHTTQPDNMELERRGRLSKSAESSYSIPSLVTPRNSSTFRRDSINDPRPLLDQLKSTNVV